MLRKILWTGMALVALLAGILIVDAAGGREASPQTTSRSGAADGSQPAVPAAGSARPLALAPALQPPLPGGAAVLTLRGAGGLYTLKASTGKVERNLGQGVLAPDGRTAYDTLHMGAAAAGGRTRWQTVVRALDAHTGRALRRRSLDGRYGLTSAGSTGPGGLSPDGRWLVLQAVADPAAPGDVPVRTEFVVLDTAFEQKPRHVVLDGVFTFDALNNSARSLFLVEYLSRPGGGHPDKYRVRFYDLAAGVLSSTIIADKRNAEQVMAGTRFKTVASADGQWLYSLYLNDGHGPFVHVLNLRDRNALCIDLPAMSKHDWKGQSFWSLLAAPGGRALYATNGALGLVAELDTVDLKISRVAEFPLPKADAGGQLSRLAHWLVPAVRAKEMPAAGGAALSPDGRTLWIAAGQGLLEVDTGSLALRGPYLTNRKPAGLLAGPDGAGSTPSASTGARAPALTSWKSNRPTATPSPSWTSSSRSRPCSG
jgi:hypothetical protein